LTGKGFNANLLALGKTCGASDEEDIKASETEVVEERTKSKHNRDDQ